MIRFFIRICQLIIMSSIFCGYAQELVCYEYWFDDDYANRNRVPVEGDEANVKMEIDVSNMNLGIHFLNVWATNSDGEISIPSRYLFYIPDNCYNDEYLLVGYEYSFNGVSKFVTFDIPIEEYEMSEMAISVPDGIFISKDTAFRLNGGKISVSGSMDVNFYLRFLNNGNEWSHPVTYDYKDVFSLEKEPINIPLQKSTEFEKVSEHDFIAFSFEISQTDKYTLTSSQACEVLLYDSAGKQLAYVPSSSMLDSYAIELKEGKYYGVMFNTVTDTENPDTKLTLQLASTFVPTPHIEYADEVVTITCSMDEAKLFYSLDGSAPTIPYEGEFSLKHNAIIQAIAKAEGYADSKIEKKEVNSYQCATPEISFTNLHVYITCATDEADIYYTLDKSDPKTNGVLYDENNPIPVSSNCTVKAYAKKEWFNDSPVKEETIDVSNVTVATPRIEREGNDVLKMSTLTDGATIYYTDDGTNPTRSSKKYNPDTKIRLEHNGEYRAFAVKDGELDSGVETHTVNWFVAQTPQLSLKDDVLTIECETPGRTIYYEIGGKTPTKSSSVYKNPIKLTDNRVVKAFAAAEWFNDSPVDSIVPTFFKCVEPMIGYDGRTLTLTCDTKDAQIYFTTDGTEPTQREENLYRNSKTLDGICTVKAIAVKPYFISREMQPFATPSYYNGDEAIVETAGSLAKAFEWCKGDPKVDALAIKGNLNDSDFEVIRRLSTTRHLDLSSANVSTLPDRAFEGMGIWTVKTPSTRFAAGKELFKGCGNLTAVVWNSMTEIPDDFLGGEALPNLLVYVKSRNVVDAGLRNVIIDDKADEIILEDSKTSNFYCPMEFEAKSITYSHFYAQHTGKDDCEGWESIALPFSPTSITHEMKGQLAPFAANDGAKKPFWLCELTSTGFESSPWIEANTPYIIAMPNNDRYSDEYILSGTVTFSGKNVRVEKSDALNYGQKDNNHFVPNLQTTPKEDAMALNVGEIYKGYKTGSIFAPNLRDVCPFESYITNSTIHSMPQQIFCIADGSTKIEGVDAEADIRIESIGDEIRVMGLTEGDVVDLWTLDGLHMERRKADSGMIVINWPYVDMLTVTVSRKYGVIKSFKLIR